MTIWITQAQYDALMVLISKIPIPDDLRPVTMLVPPLERGPVLVQTELVNTPRRLKKLIQVRFSPALRDPRQSRDEPPELIWKLDADVQICEEWLAEEMQSMII